MPQNRDDQLTEHDFTNPNFNKSTTAPIPHFSIAIKRPLIIQVHLSNEKLPTHQPICLQLLKSANYKIPVRIKRHKMDVEPYCENQDIKCMQRS